MHAVVLLLAVLLLQMTTLATSVQVVHQILPHFMDPLEQSAFTLLANLEPNPPPGTGHGHWRAVDNLLTTHWDHAGRSGFGQYIGHDRQYTYGEVTHLGGRQLAAQFQLGVDRNGPQQVFVDVGSGVGKLVVQMLLDNPGLHRSVGVELSLDRHHVAQAAWAAAVKSGDVHHFRPRTSTTSSERSDEVEFIASDVLSPDLDLRQATHLYAAGLCFPPAVLQALSLMLNDRSRFPRLQVVASLKQLHELSMAKGWQQSPPFEVQVTWGRANVWLYRRNLDPKAPQI
jgi:hypothetical protein